MMKWIIAVAAVGVAYAGASYYTGTQAENYLKHYTETEIQQLRDLGIEAKLVSYDRGWFTSRAKFDIANTERNIVMQSHIDLQHGPVLFNGGLGFGYLSGTTRIDSLTFENTNESLANYLKSIKAVSQVSFTGGQSLQLNFPQVSETLGEDKAVIDFSGGKIEVKVSEDLKKVRFNGQLGELNVHNKANSADGLVVAKTVFSGKAYEMADALYATQFNLRTANIAWNESSLGQTLAIKKLVIDQDYKVKGDKFDSWATFSADAIDGAFPITKPSLKVSFEDFGIASMKHLQDTVNEISLSETLTEDQKPVKVLQSLFSSLNNQVVVRVDYTGQMLDGAFAINADAKVKDFVAQDDGAIEDLMQSALAAAELNAHVRLDQSIVNETPLGMMLMMGGFSSLLVEDKSDFVLDYALAGGVSRVNGAVIGGEQ